MYMYTWLNVYIFCGGQEQYIDLNSYLFNDFISYNLNDVKFFSEKGLCLYSSVLTSVMTETVLGT